MKRLGSVVLVIVHLRRLVEAGLLKREQAAPRAPWEIRRSDLGAEPVQSISKAPPDRQTRSDRGMYGKTT